MRIRVAAVIVIAAGLVGCGDDTCPTESADVIAVDVPTSCSVAAGETVTVEIPICATCNETSPTCEADLSGVGTGVIHLDTRAEACTQESSCPVPSCEIGQADRRIVSCTFTAPPPDDYDLLVYDGGSNSTVTVPFSTTGSATTCSGT